MRRRKVLASLASGTILVSGCNSVANDLVDESEGTSTNPSTAAAASDTETPAPEPTVEATVIETTAAPREYETWTQFGVRSRVENTGDVWLAAVNVSARFYNQDGQLLNTGAGGARALQPGDIWEFWIPYSGEAEDVASAEVDVSDAFELNRTLDPDTTEVISSTVEIPRDEGAYPAVTATVTNTSVNTVPYLQAHPKLYDGDGLLIGTGTTSVSDLESNQEWRINSEIYMQNSAWKDRVEDHEIILVA